MLSEKVVEYWKSLTPIKQERALIQMCDALEMGEELNITDVSYDRENMVDVERVSIYWENSGTLLGEEE